MVGSFKFRARFLVQSKSYLASNAENGAESCGLQLKMRSDVHDSIAAGCRSLDFRDRIPHSAFAKDIRSFVSSLYLARRDRRALSQGLATSGAAAKRRYFAILACAYGNKR